MTVQQRTLDLSPSPKYISRKSGPLSYISPNCIAYIELTRITSPSGFLYLYMPCLFGTFLVAIISPPQAPSTLLSKNLIFLFGSALVRSAGCGWNDLIDQDLDRRVSRTQHRPIARGALSTQQALLFTTILVGIGLLLLVLLLPLSCLLYSIPSIALTAVYPFAKRVTNYPQVVLGFVSSWGVVMAFPALDVNIFGLAGYSKMSIVCLYMSCLAWTALYDTVYAGQDTKDDVKVGIKSVAVYYKGSVKKFLIGAAIIQQMLLIAAGNLIQASPVFFIGTCCGTAILQGIMIRRVKLGDPSSCNWWFKKGCAIFGLSIASGLVGENIVRSFLNAANSWMNKLWSS